MQACYAASGHPPTHHSPWALCPGLALNSARSRLILPPYMAPCMAACGVMLLLWHLKLERQEVPFRNPGNDWVGEVQLTSHTCTKCWTATLIQKSQR